MSNKWEWDDIKQIEVKSNGWFGILEEPKPHKQHPNQQNGLDLYIKVINFDTGEVCFKKLYTNKKGLHFMHRGTPSAHYLDDFDGINLYVPFQIMSAA